MATVGEMAETGRQRARRSASRSPSARRSALPFPSAQEVLTPTARQLLEAARRVVERSGYWGLTNTSIGKEAGLSPNLVSYHFRSRAGLLVALLEWFIYDALWDVDQQPARLQNDEGQVPVFMQMTVRMLAKLDFYRLWYELLSHVLEDAGFRARLAELYRSYTASNVRAILSGHRVEETPQVRVIASLTVGMSDGLAVQLLADPEGVDVRLAASVREQFISWLLAGNASSDASG
jgi:AcrR family transcriptional regulator